MSTTYLTPAGFEKLQQELTFLRTTKRKEIADLLHEMLEGEDFGADFEAGYESARDLQAFIEGRIIDLEAILANVQIIQHPKSRESVELGSAVTIMDTVSGEIETYTLVSPAETDPRQGYISDQSPLGKALLGRRILDDINVKTPDGHRVIRLLNID